MRETLKLMFGSTPVRLELLNGRDAALNFIRERGDFAPGVMRAYEGVIAATDGEWLELRHRRIWGRRYVSPRFRGWLAKAADGRDYINGAIAIPFRTRLVRGGALTFVLVWWIAAAVIEFAIERWMPVGLFIIVPPVMLGIFLLAMRIESRGAADDIREIQRFLVEASNWRVT